MHPNENNKQTKELFEGSFLAGITHATENLDKEEKLALDKILATMVNKWSFSSLLPDTAISPANIMNNCKIAPDGVNRFKLKHNISTDVYELELIYNDTKNHSFINDMRFVLEHFTPSNSMADLALHPYDIPEELRERGILDPFYYSYLMLMLKRLNLITKMASINAEVYQKNIIACKIFFETPVTEMLKTIADQAFQVFEENMEDSLFQELVITKEDSLKAITESTSVDDIFNIIYLNLGFDFKHMVDIAENDIINSEDEALLSSVYYVGTLLDKWLFTPFGAYLNLITPVYVEPYDFVGEVEFIRPILLTGCNLTAELFSPCNYYYLTPIGETLFGETENDEEISLRNTPFSYDQLFAALITQKSQKNVYHFDKTRYNTLVELSVKVSNKHNLWKTIELPDVFKLKRLYSSISYFFGFEETQNYTFKLKSNLGQKSPVKRFDRLSEFQLKNLNLGDNNLVLRSDEETYEISLVSTKKGDFSGDYPKLLRQSRDITIIERNENF